MTLEFIKSVTNHLIIRWHKLSEVNSSVTLYEKALSKAIKTLKQPKCSELSFPKVDLKGV
jgi:hypothetical protein